MLWESALSSSTAMPFHNPQLHGAANIHYLSEKNTCLKNPTSEEQLYRLGRQRLLSEPHRARDDAFPAVDVQPGSQEPLRDRQSAATVRPWEVFQEIQPTSSLFVINPKSPLCSKHKHWFYFLETTFCCCCFLFKCFFWFYHLPRNWFLTGQFGDASLTVQIPISKRNLRFAWRGHSLGGGKAAPDRHPPSAVHIQSGSQSPGTFSAPGLARILRARMSQAKAGQ